MSNHLYAGPGQRWIVRRDRRHRARYYQGPHVGDDFRWGRWQRGAWRMTQPDAARVAGEIGGKPVRLLSREEAKQRAEAKGRAEALTEVRRMLDYWWKRQDEFAGRASLLDEIGKAVARMACPCQGPLDDPGPDHVDACPWKDPEYEPKGGMW